MKAVSAFLLRRIAPSVAALALLSFGTGCGVLSAATNPKVAWALNDPAPMTVVVRRADAAEKTSKEVDRLLTATPTGSDADWMAHTAPSDADAATEMKTLTQDPVYARSKSRVVPAEVWTRTLPGVTSTGGDQPNLLAAVDDDLADRYAKILKKKEQIAGLRARIADLQAAIDDKDTPDADRDAKKSKVDELKKRVDAKEDEIEPLQKDFVAAARAAAQKTPADRRDRLGVAFINLRQAVDDALIADDAAALRYPLAVPTLLGSVQAKVPEICADVIEEKTGKRPSMQGLQPDVKLEGTHVALTLNGLDDSDLGKLSVGDVTSETLSRTETWVSHALGLLGTIASTKEVLTFEGDVLSALVDGFQASGWSPAPAPKIPAQDDPKVASATAKTTAKPADADTTATAAAPATLGPKAGKPSSKLPAKLPPKKPSKTSGSSKNKP